MGRVVTNNISLQYAIESSVGTLPGSPAWKLLEPNTINEFGATITTVSRKPISKNRQNQKGTTTDLDSAVGFEADLTMETFLDFIEGFAFAAANGTVFAPTATTAGGSGGYTVASGGALAANTLVFASGFTNSTNNGLKVVASGSGATNVRVNSLVAETVTTQNAVLEIAGVRGSAGDLEIDANGDLESTVLDFTTLGLTVGQSIWIGGSASANKFATAANNGFARIEAITANLITLNKRSQAYSVDNGATKEIDIFFGRFVRNVDVDDGDYLERSFQFELAMPNLDSDGDTMYEYAKGNYCNTVSFGMPLTNKASVTFGFIGTDTEVPTETRKTNASSAKSPVRKVAFNTSSDFARLRLQEYDETGLSTYFKNLTITLNNNVTPEKVLGTLGATYLNTGSFDVNVEATLLFTNSAVVDAIRNNETVTLDFAITNDNGGILVDLPSITIGGGSKDFPVNESVTINTNATAFEDSVLGTSIGISIFPYLP